MLALLLRRFRSMGRRARALVVTMSIVVWASVVGLLVGAATGATALAASIVLGVVLLGSLAAVLYVVAHPALRRRPSIGSPATVDGAGAATIDPPIAARHPELVDDLPQAALRRWYSTLSHDLDRSLVAHAIATRSSVARDVLALRATAGRFDLASLARVLEATAHDSGQRDALLGPLDLDALGGLGEAVFLDAELGDSALARHLVELLLDRRSALNLSARQALAEHAVRSGLSDAAMALLRESRQPLASAEYLGLDLLNPFVDPPRAALEPWTAGLNAVFARAGLEPCRIAEEGRTPFDRLRASAPPIDDESLPLVSVIMSAYEPDEALLTAVESMRAQTWTRWELLVMDDASASTSAQAVLDRVAALDERVRVVRAAVNAGTYVRRNEGLLLAQGEFVTMQDSDDWVHPRRIELQARHLLAHPDELANVSQSVRVTEQLLFVTRRGGGLKTTESSIMLRRAAALRVAGTFDPLRRAADSEYRARLEAITGRPVALVAVGAPLSIVRLQARSLSGGDISIGRMHPARVAYKSAHQRWHETLAARGTSPRPDVAEFEPSARPFAVHPHLSGAPAERRALDVLVVLDPRRGAGHDERLRRAVAELTAWVDRGLAVGVMRLEAMASVRPGAPAVPALQDLINSQRIIELLPGDDTEVGTVVLRDPAALAGLADRQPLTRAARLIVVDPAAAPTPALAVETAHAVFAPDGTVEIIDDGRGWARAAADVGTVAR